MSSKIYVYYYIQNDPCESIKEPNLYILTGDFQDLNNVKAKLIYNSFPLREKFNFYLRFFLDDKAAGVYILYILQ